MSAQRPVSPDDNIFPEAIPEPEAIQAQRRLIDRLISMVDGGEIESVSVYAQMRNGTYLNLQTESVSRHEDTGSILEPALFRLGFSQVPAEGA